MIDGRNYNFERGQRDSNIVFILKRNIFPRIFKSCVNSTSQTARL